MDEVPPDEPAGCSRVRDAARYLGAEPDRLPDAVCAFAGEPAPAAPVARRLLADAFTALDSVPRGILAVHDLRHTAGDWPGVPRTLPPTPHEAVTLVRALASLLHPLNAGELRAAAAGFALRRGSLYLALRAEEVRRFRDLPRIGLLPVLGNGDDPAGMLSTEDEQARTGALRETPPRDWTDEQLAAVRKTLLEHLAGLGDSLLRVTEHAPAPLEWNRDDASRHYAAVPVPGSPEPLEARLEPEPARESVIPGAGEPLWPGSPPCPARARWRWEAGWRAPGGAFIAQAGTTEKTYAAAVFAAEQTIAGYLAAAPDLRQRWTGRLLVPRTHGLLSAADPSVKVITWPGLLRGVSCEDFSLPSPAGEFLAAVLETLQVPRPGPGEPGAGSRPGEAAFDAFLASHAIVLALPVRAYLAGVTRAALDGQPVRDHHAAGLRHVLDESADQPHGRLTADLGPLPAGMDWTDLYEPEGLERFLDADWP